MSEVMVPSNMAVCAQPDPPEFEQLLVDLGRLVDRLNSERLKYTEISDALIGGEITEVGPDDLEKPIPTGHFTQRCSMILEDFRFEVCRLEDLNTRLSSKIPVV